MPASLVGFADAHLSVLLQMSGCEKTSQGQANLGHQKQTSKEYCSWWRRNEAAMPSKYGLADDSNAVRFAKVLIQAEFANNLRMPRRNGLRLKDDQNGLISQIIQAQEDVSA